MPGCAAWSATASSPATWRSWTPRRPGYDLLCFVSVGLRAHDRAEIDRFRDAVAAMPEVLEVHHVTGEYDYLLRVVLHNRRDLERFAVDRLAPLPGIGRIQTSLVLREVKRTTALPLSSTPGPADRALTDNPEEASIAMAHEPLHTMGQQFGRRSWAEPWKIKMVEPHHS